MPKPAAASTPVPREITVTSKIIRPVGGRIHWPYPAPASSLRAKRTSAKSTRRRPRI